MPTRRYETTIWTLDVGPEEWQTLLANADLVAEVNLFRYTLDRDGAIFKDGGAGDTKLVEELRAAGIRVLPTIGNAFDPARVSVMLNDSARRAAHVAALVALVEQGGFDGIDVDYESLYRADRDAFSGFIEELAAQLHARTLLLSIAVHPKTSEPGSWDGPMAQDYARLGAAVDFLKVMTYDYSWSTSPPGPIAPVAWAQQVMDFTTSQVPPRKIYLGVHFYGYDWLGEHAEGRIWSETQAILASTGATVTRDVSSEATFVYEQSGSRTVFFADALSVGTKLEAVFAAHPDLAGIAIWRLGGEDPANWGEIRAWAMSSESH